MASNSENSFDLKYWLTLVAQVILAFAIFLALSAWQSRDMLADEERVSTLTAQTLDGQILSFPEQRRETNSLLYFFAPWCTICHLSIENLNYVQSQYPDLNIMIVALDYQNVSEVQEFMNEHDLDYPVLLGTRQWADTYKISAFPSYYVINARGDVVSQSMGYSTVLGMLARVAQVED